MNTFEDLLQYYVNLDFDQLVARAKNAVEAVMPDCKRVDPENNGYFMLCSIILSAVGADGKLTPLEDRFLREVMGIDRETTDKLIQLYTPDMVDIVNDFADKLSRQNKINTATLLLAFLSCDEKISPEETGLIKKVID